MTRLRNPATSYWILPVTRYICTGGSSPYSSATLARKIKIR